MAAYRAGIRTVYIPAENLQDLDEVDPVVLAALDIRTADIFDDIAGGALCEIATEQPVFAPVSSEVRQPVVISQ